MTSETVELESGTEIDAEPSPQQQQRRNKMRMRTEKKKKSGRRRRKCSCSSSIQGGLANVQHDLPTSRVPIFHRSLSLYSSSSTAGFASLSTKQDHTGNRRRRIDKCQNQGSSTAQRRSTDDARVAACEFTRVWEEKSSTQEEEEEEYASSSSSEEEEEERLDPLRTTTHPCFNSTNSISTCRIRSRSRNLSLSNKYRPKTFEDIIGHEINIKALSSAIHNDMVAPLYLFHGPSGTGKTSTATIFAMASNCESSASAAASASAWPCWSCRGCSTSIYINDLFCSPGSRGGGGQGGVERIKTLLLQSTALARTFKVKVFVTVEEEGCLAWDQLPSIVDYCRHDGSVVLVMVTSSNEGMGASGGAVPKAVSSRCQKFGFPKLKDTDVILKLARIAAEEGIRIDSDALGLIAAKADGSIREAENILEQMSLLGSTITSSMVQQLVGLVPRSKLLSLLDAAMSSDAITTARRTRKLIALGVQPQALISQLAALITEILSGASVPLCKDKKKRPSRRRIRSQRLCHALKILIETEKQLQSSRDHATKVVAALLEFASDRVSNIISTNIVLPKDIISADENTDKSNRRNSIDVILKEQCDLVHHSRTTTHHLMNGLQELPSISAGNEADTSARRTDSADNCTAKMIHKPKWALVSDMDEVWQNILGRIHSPYLREFLLQQGKLVSLTVSRANAIVHILFKCREDKLALEMSEEAISKALSEAFSCPVAVNLSLQPIELEEMERVTVPKNEVADPSSSGQQTAPFLPLFKQPHNLGAAEIVLKQRAGQTFASKLEHNLSQIRHLDSTQMFQGHEVNMAQRYQTPTFSGILTQGSRGDESIVQGKASIMKMPHHKTCNISSTQLRHRWQSLSSIQQADASVEPYSQDLLFENVHTDGKQGTRQNPEKLCRVLSLATGCHHRGEPGIVLNRSWSCTDTICRDQKNMKMKVKVGKLVETMNSSLLSLLKWRPRRDYSSAQGEDLPSSG